MARSTTRQDDRGSTRSYRQWCPVTRTLDLVGDRWTLLIVRDLLFGLRRFAELRSELVGISPTLLSDRLRMLREHDLVRVDDGRYELTARGRALAPVIQELGRWGIELMGPPKDDDTISEFFPRAALGFLLRPERLPDHTVTATIHLDDRAFTVAIGGVVDGQPALERIDVTDGGHVERDVVVRTTLPALTRYRQGRWTADDLIARGFLALEGDEMTQRVLLHCFGPDVPLEPR